MRLRALELVSNEIYGAKVTGNVAEVGVANGDFAQIINYKFPDKKLYMFDTFEGFDQAKKNYEIQEGFTSRKWFAKSADFKNVNGPDYVMSRLPYPKQATIRMGVFPKTAEGLEEDQFAFVSIDVDLYLPILNSLKFFYPKLSPGGYIFIHDYNAVEFQGVSKAVKDFEVLIGMSLKKFPLSDFNGSLVVTK